MPLDPKKCTHPNAKIVNEYTNATLTPEINGIPFTQYHAPNVLIRYCPDCDTYFTYHIKGIWWSETK